MDRLCEKGDVIQCSDFWYWEAPGNVWDQTSGPTHPGHDWLVEGTEMTGGGHGYDGDYPNGHRVIAVMLDGCGGKIYRPDNPIRITFYQSGCFTRLFKPEGIELRGTFEWTGEYKRSVAKNAANA